LRVKEREAERNLLERVTFFSGVLFPQLIRTDARLFSAHDKVRVMLGHLCKTQREREKKKRERERGKWIFSLFR
jgi:hypothetical protein